jgi:NADP-dependent 3-hydroxy acid dehydrogenase YdfG
MDRTDMNKIISDKEWIEARKALLKKETLKDKVVVIYGAAGAVGSTAAHAFAQEGATVFLTGRSISKLNKVADEISSADLSADLTGGKISD